MTLQAPAITQPRRDRRLFEALTFYAALGLYGARTGAMINEVAGIRLNRDPAEWFVLPTLFGGAGIAIALAVDRPHHIRRGRGFAIAAGLTLGQVSLSALGYFRGERHRPRGDPFSSPLLWLGATVGLTTGMLVGELLDPTEGSGTFVVAFGVGGALSGAALCGIAGCGHDLGLWVFGGEVALTAGALAGIALVHPNEVEVRWAVLGALVGALPGSVMLALGPSEAFDFNGRNAAGYALSVGGLLGVGVTSLALARAFGLGRSVNRDPRPSTAWVLPTVSAGPGSMMLGLSLPSPL